MPRIIEGREVVIRPHGENWSFALPHGHDVQLTAESATLEAGYSNSGYKLAGTSKAYPGELVVELGDWQADITTSYPIPTFAVEKDRMEVRCGEVGGDWLLIGAWANGDEHESYLRRIRGELRALEAAKEAA